MVSRKPCWITSKQPKQAVPRKRDRCFAMSDIYAKIEQSLIDYNQVIKYATGLKFNGTLAVVQGVDMMYNIHRDTKEVSDDPNGRE